MVGNAPEGGGVSHQTSGIPRASGAGNNLSVVVGGGDRVSETSVLWASCGLQWPCGLPPPPLDVDGPRGVAITEVAPGPRAMNLEGQPGHHRGTAWEEQGSKAQRKEAGEHMYTHVQMLHKSRHTYTHAHRRVSAHPHTRTCV